MSAKSLRQPLITRPAYGKGHRTVAESGLPEGPPAGKGVSVDQKLPGTKTFVKDTDAPARDFDKGDDESLYRTDNADDQLQSRDRIEVKDENANKHDSVGQWGKGEWDSSSKTKYPYRDNKTNHHEYENQRRAAEYVLAVWEADQAPERVIYSEITTKVAFKMSEIQQRLNPKTKQRSAGCKVRLKRADISNLRWIMAVDCGNGLKVVKLKGDRSGNVTKLSAMDLSMSCSCHAWRWLGPEYHAKSNEYLDGKPRGTASVPVIKDPRRINKVCKHVAAVLGFVRKWDVAKRKK